MSSSLTEWEGKAEGLKSKRNQLQGELEECKRKRDHLAAVAPLSSAVSQTSSDISATLLDRLQEVKSLTTELNDAMAKAAEAERQREVVFAEERRLQDQLRAYYDVVSILKIVP